MKHSPARSQQVFNPKANIYWCTHVTSPLQSTQWMHCSRAVLKAALCCTVRVFTARTLICICNSFSMLFLLTQEKTQETRNEGESSNRKFSFSLLQNGCFVFRFLIGSENKNHKFNDSAHVMEEVVQGLWRLNQCVDAKSCCSAFTLGGIKTGVVVWKQPRTESRI